MLLPFALLLLLLLLPHSPTSAESVAVAGVELRGIRRGPGGAATGCGCAAIAQFAAIIIFTAHCVAGLRGHSAGPGQGQGQGQCRDLANL